MSVRTIDKVEKVSKDTTVDQPQPKGRSHAKSQPKSPAVTVIPGKGPRSDSGSGKVGVPAGMPFQVEAKGGRRPSSQKKERVHPTPPAEKTRPTKVEDGPATEPEPQAVPPVEDIDRNTEATEESKLRQRLSGLGQAAKEQKPGAIEALREFLDEHPSIYQRIGDTALAARFAFAELMAERSPVEREAILKQSEALLKEYLPGDGQCPTERILAEQVVVSYLRVNYFDYQSSNHAMSTNSKLCGQLLKKQEQAQNQLFKAINKLETYRRLKSKPE